MLVRPGQHVSGDGKVYHPYLVKWAGFWDVSAEPEIHGSKTMANGPLQKSSLLDLVAILREIFAKEPPVIANQAAQTSSRQPTMAPTPPPPLPAPPEDWRRGQQPTPHTSGIYMQQGQDGRPPPLPPKNSGLADSTFISALNGATRPYDRGPPLPPLPPLNIAEPRSSSQSFQQDYGARPPPHIPTQSRQSSLRRESSPHGANYLPAHMRYQQSHHELESPVSPLTPSADIPQRQLPPHHQPHSQYGGPNQYQQYPSTQHSYQQLPPQYQHPGQQPAQRPAIPKPEIDLLSSPLDVQLPGQTGSPAAPVPVPPVPPNPEKDALLHALSQALVSQAHQIVANNNAAYQSLSAQHQALLAAQQKLQVELDQLSYLSSTLDSNEHALRQGIQQIDTSIASAASRHQPEIDEVLVCPSTVGQQVYSTVAEEQAARDVRLALGKTLDRGRVGVKEYVKEMRGVGRDEFFRKVIIRKAGVGMGLDLSAVESRS